MAKEHCAKQWVTAACAFLKSIVKRIMTLSNILISGFWCHSSSYDEFEWQMVALSFINSKSYHLWFRNEIISGAEYCKNHLFYTLTGTDQQIRKHVCSPLRQLQLFLLAFWAHGLVWHLQSNLGFNNVSQIQLLRGGSGQNCRMSPFSSPKLNTSLNSV